MTPKVSVIIRTYNRAHLIERAIKSVLNQSFRDFEIIVVNDGSTDDTKEKVEKLAAKDSRIKLFTQNQSGGKVGQVTNFGLKHSHGRYIAILDTDDEWLPSKLEKQVKLLESADSHIGLVTCCGLLVNPNGTQKELSLPPRSRPFLESILRRSFFHPSSILIKKEVLDSVGPYDENYQIMDDWDMFLRIAQKYEYDFVNESLYKYHIHQTNTSYGGNYTYARQAADRLATDLEYLLNKHHELFKQYPRRLAYRYTTLASLLFSAGDMKKARSYLRKNLELRGSLKNRVLLACSYFGKSAFHLLWSRILN